VLGACRASGSDEELARRSGETSSTAGAVFMRILVVGCGGVGGIFGGRLSATAEVVFLCRTGTHFDALSKDGLQLTDGQEEVAVKAKYVTSLSGEPVFDLVVVTNKIGPEQTAVLDSLEGALAADGTIFSLQNGVEASIELGERFGARALAAQCWVLSQKAGPGKVVCKFRKPQCILFGELRKSEAFAKAAGAPSARCVALAEVFEKVGLPVDLPPDCELKMWDKFLISSCYSLWAIARAPFNLAYSCAPFSEALRKGMEETRAVGAAYGIMLPDDAVSKYLQGFKEAPSGATCSTLRDFVDGNPTEADGLGGAVVRLGAKCEPPVPTPTHELVLALMAPMEAKARGELSF